MACQFKDSKAQLLYNEVEKREELLEKMKNSDQTDAYKNVREARLAEIRHFILLIRKIFPNEHLNL